MAIFIFRYDPQYAAKPNAVPISAFPDIHEEYRSCQLWPFFADRRTAIDVPDRRTDRRTKGCIYYPDRRTKGCIYYPIDVPLIDVQRIVF